MCASIDLLPPRLATFLGALLIVLMVSGTTWADDYVDPAPPFTATNPIPADEDFVPFYCDGLPAWDPLGDDQGGHRDIVGDTDRPAVLRVADDNFLYLRVRLDDTPQQGQRLKAFGWGFLFDIPPLFSENPENSTYDFLLHVEGSGGHNGLMRLRSNEGQLDMNNPAAPAAGERIWLMDQDVYPFWHVKPATGAPFNGASDYWLTVAVPWARLEPHGITREGLAILWVGTSTSNQSINRDFACHQAGTTLTLDGLSFEPHPLDPATDFCEFDYDSCHDDAQCIDLPGGTYTCECNDGFQGDGQECAPITPNLVVDSPADGGALTHYSFSVSGTSDPGDIIEVYIDDEFVGTTTADANGNWSLPAEVFEDGQYTLTVEAINEWENSTVVVHNFSVSENHCLNELDSCSINSQCINIPDGTYYCECDPGYTGTYCEFVDPCYDDNDNQCSPNSQCIDTEDGNYTCECDPGFTGIYCELENLCLNDDANLCSDHSECVDNQDGTYYCVCDPGYTGTHCEFVDPCYDDNDNQCSPNSECIDTEDGNYLCDCDPGYVGTYCDAYDPCSHYSTNECRADSQCIDNQDGTYLCECDPGYTGPYCEFEDPCFDDDANQCSDNSECVDLEDGTYECDCDPGYVGTYCEDLELELTVSAPSNGAHVASATPLFEGTGTPGETVEIWIDGTLAGETTVAPDGTWSWSPDASLADGTYDVLVAINRGDESVSEELSFTVDTVAPEITIDEPADGEVLTAAPAEVSGQTEPNTTVIIYVDGEPVGQTTSDEEGNWSYEFEDELEEGARTITVEAIDAAGNVGSADHDIVIDPSEPVHITSPSSGDEVRTSTPVISGTGEPGDEVIITVNGEEVATVTVAEDGTWSWMPEVPLDDGDITIEAESTSRNGITTVDTVTFTIDTFVTGVVITTADETVTNDNQPTISGTAEPGSDVDIYVNDEYVGTVTADDNGNWSWTPDEPLDDGDHVITAQPAEGGPEHGDSITVTVDTVPPDLTATPGERDGNGTVVIEGTGEPGAEVDIYVDGELVGTTTVDEDGNWSYEIDTNEEGDTNVVIIGRDRAGNETVIEFDLTPEELEELARFVVSGGGLSCSATSPTPGAGFVLTLLLGLLGLRLRRRKEDR